jgi:cellulose synthase (UDP-forming)
MALLLVSGLVGVVRMAVGQAPVVSTSINLVWIVFDLVVLSVVVRAARYRGFEPQPVADQRELAAA